MVDVLPLSYLGMPLGAKATSKTTWDPVERFDKYLSPWRRKYLTKGARITLITNVLSSLPLYYFTVFKAPASVIDRLEKKMRDFLWGSDEEHKKSTLFFGSRSAVLLKMGVLVSVV